MCQPKILYVEKWSNVDKEAKPLPHHENVWPFWGDYLAHWN
jgi:hypothetical protein